MPDVRKRTPEERAATRAEATTAVLWHVAAYLIINAYLWVVVPEAALWVTIGWGIGLAFHVAAWIIGEGGTDSRRYRRYLAQERARDDETAD